MKLLEEGGVEEAENETDVAWVGFDVKGGEEWVGRANKGEEAVAVFAFVGDSFEADGT